MEMTDDGESDEFARLLAQLNGTTSPEPTIPEPSPPQPAPGLNIPATPVPLEAPVAAPIAAPLAPPQAQDSTPSPSPTPTPIPAQSPAPDRGPSAPVAPAFGVAVPVPTLAPWTPAPAVPGLSFPPPVAASALSQQGTPLRQEGMAPPEPVPAHIETVSSAPELRGADELAAPPAPPVMAAPPAGTPSSAPPPTSQPLTPPAAAGAVGDTAAPPSRRSASGDFSQLIATPADDGGTAHRSGPLLPGAARNDDEPDIARSNLAERIALVLAVVIAPLGLIAGVVAAVLSARRRGWVIGLVRATIAVGAVLTVVLAISGYYGYTVLQKQQLHDQTASASAAFCATLKANPTMDQLPTFGWPAVAASVPDSVKAMQAYEDRWSKLADVSPPGIKVDVQKVATAAKGIIDSVNVTRTVNDASNVAIMSEVASSSGVPAWRAEYCG